MPMNCPVFPAKGFGDDADPSIGRDDDVEGSARDSRIERFAEMRVRMDVLDVGANLGNFVCAAMKYRDRVAAIAQAVYEKRSAGTGTTDYEGALHLKFLICDPTRGAGVMSTQNRRSGKRTQTETVSMVVALDCNRVGQHCEAAGKMRTQRRRNI